MCHLLLFLPLLALPVFWLLPLPAAVPLYLLALALSAWMYRALMHSRRHHAAGGADGMLGATAEVVRTDGRRGVVRLHGEFWNARLRGDPCPGDLVSVEGVEGLSLRVSKKGIQPARHPDADASAASGGRGDGTLVEGGR